MIPKIKQESYLECLIFLNIHAPIIFDKRNNILIFDKRNNIYIIPNTLTETFLSIKIACQYK